MQKGDEMFILITIIHITIFFFIEKLIKIVFNVQTATTKIDSFSHISKAVWQFMNFTFYNKYYDLIIATLSIGRSINFK